LSSSPTLLFTIVLSILSRVKQFTKICHMTK